MSKTVIGSFSDYSAANKAISDLKATGLTDADISVVAKETEKIKEMTQKGSGQVADSTATGAVTGAGLGALTGLLVGLGALAVPGGFIVAGPIAAALGLTGTAAATVTGTTVGTLAGGLVGSLAGLGMPQEEAKVISDRIEAGDLLLIVNDNKVSEQMITDTFKNNNANNVRTINR